MLSNSEDYVLKTCLPYFNLYYLYDRVNYTVKFMWSSEIHKLTIFTMIII